jgi:hypothetical protein
LSCWKSLKCFLTNLFRLFIIRLTMVINTWINTYFRWRWRIDQWNNRQQLRWWQITTVIVRIWSYFGILNKFFLIRVFRKPTDKKWIKLPTGICLRSSFSKTLWRENRFCFWLPLSYCLCTSNKWIIFEFKFIIMLRKYMWTSFRLKSKRKKKSSTNKFLILHFVDVRISSVD